MEEDKRVYFNDEWNNSIIDNPEIKKWQELYNITLIKLEKLLEEELIKNHSNGITTLPKEFNDDYRQLECRCDLPRPNRFTGNCVNCNLTIKPKREINADKRTE